MQKLPLALMMFVTTAPAVAQTSNCMVNGPFLNCNSSDGSLTQCNRTGAILNCNTTGGVQSNMSRNERASNNGSGGSLVGFLRSVEERRMRSKVLKALKAGDCPLAISTALDGNDMELVSGVQAYCARQAATASAAP